RCLARIGFLLVPASILLIKYYPQLGQQWSEGRTFFTGVALDKNMLGLVCLVSGLGCVWRLIEASRGRAGIRKSGPLIAQGALLTMVLLLLARINSMTSLANTKHASEVIELILARSNSTIVRRAPCAISGPDLRMPARPRDASMRRHTHPSPETRQTSPSMFLSSATPVKKVLPS